jgi:hypothetical protein
MDAKCQEYGVVAHGLQYSFADGASPNRSKPVDENGLGNHGTNAAQAQKPGERSDDMNEKDEDMTHHSIVARPANAGNYCAN